MSKHPKKLPSIIPSGEYCFGRDDFCAELEDGVIQSRSSLLFGGRQAGKTTLLLRLQKRVNQKNKRGGLRGNLNLAVYVNLLELPPDATPATFFRKLAKQTVEACRDCVRGFSLKRLPSHARPQDSSPDIFALDLKQILSACHHKHVRPIFLLDESKRILGDRFPRGFQDNLFTLLYGNEFGLGGRICIVFSGAQEIYQFCIDDTSPIGSRASKHILTNLTPKAVAEMVRETSSSIPPNQKTTIAKWLHEQAGGHAGLTCGLLRSLGGLNATDETIRQRILVSFREQHAETLNLWFASLSKEARCVHDLLLKQAEITLPQIVRCLSKNGLDCFKADRAREQLQFTGVARWEGKVLSRTNQLYWNYVGGFSLDENELKAETGKGKQTRPSEKITGPFKFDWIQNTLIGASGLQLELPIRFALVLKAMLTRDPANRKARVSKLPYKIVALCYKKGWIEEKSPSADRATRDFRLEQSKKEIERNPKQLAQKFAPDFKRWLRKHGIDDKAVLSPVKNYGYRLGQGWFGELVINDSEASVISGHSESFPEVNEE